VWSTARVSRKSKAPAAFRIPIVFMDEAEILSVRPLDGDFSVRDIIREYKLFVKRRSEGMPKAEAVALIPLMGKTTKRYSECDYCTVRGKCGELAGEAAW
jgi:hypothetical protein